MTARPHRVLTDSFELPIPPDQAFPLFTARGERLWADGWEPRFPALAGDDTVPGTVFQTTAHDRDSTWIVVHCRPGRSISYARVTEGWRAATVTVSLDELPAGCRVTVSYDETSLDPAADDELHRFAAGYHDYLISWQDEIERYLARVAAV